MEFLNNKKFILDSSGFDVDKVGIQQKCAKNNVAKGARRIVDTDVGGANARLPV